MKQVNVRLIFKENPATRKKIKPTNKRNVIQSTRQNKHSHLLSSRLLRIDNQINSHPFDKTMLTGEN